VAAISSFSQGQGDAAVQLARTALSQCGHGGFLVDADSEEWFFISEPRIQVEHTVTEMVTGVDLVRSQILVAQGHKLHEAPLALPQQNALPLHGAALQCRITTEDPENNFSPDYGKITTYRSPAGFGIRLDGGTAYGGAVLTPYYDSLLVKVTAWGNTLPEACQRMDRALREFRIRGVKTNIPFLENVVNHPTFQNGQTTTTFLDETPELFRFIRRRDRATRLLNYLADVIINGNPEVAGRSGPKATVQRSRPPTLNRSSCLKCRSPGCAAGAWHSPDAAGDGPEEVCRMDTQTETAACHRHDISRCPPVVARHARTVDRHSAGS
jgi:pyruvate carboxylase